MYAYIVQQASSVGEPRRPDVVASALEARLPNAGPRRALGVALVAIGQRIAGEMPARPTAQPDGDCA